VFWVAVVPGLAAAALLAEGHRQNRRLDREAVKDHSPGLPAWGSHPREKRPEGATDVGIRRQTAQYFMNAWCRKHIRSPLQGDFHLFVDPGLKAWAIVSNRFAVKYNGLLPNFFAASLPWGTYFATGSS